MSTKVSANLTGNFNVFLHDWIYFLAPEILLCVFVFVILLIISAIFYVSKTKINELEALEYRSQATIHLIKSTEVMLWIVASIYILLFVFEYEQVGTVYLLNGYFRFDLYTTFIKILLTFTTIFVIRNSLSNSLSYILEFSFLILSSLLFLGILVSANDLMLIFICIMGFSINTYVLLMLPTENLVNFFAYEAGIKYFYLSALSSGLIAFGLSIMYFLLSTTNLNSVAHLQTVLQVGSHQTLVAIMLVSVIYGFLFKLAAFPGHM